MRMSRPSAFSRESELREPGTLTISPKVVSVMPGWRPISMAMSMSRFAVTQTGQPGPESSVTFSGMRSRSPLRAMETVWVPHTSMIFMGRVAAPPMAAASFKASCGSRNAAEGSGVMGERA
jgi:hypothetical protein